MKTAWVRLSYTCQNACLFCNDADNLNGTIVGLDEVKAALDAAAGSGATRVVLSGGEPMLSKHFLAAIKHAKSLGLYVAVTSNGRVVKSKKIVDVLVAAGLDEVRISVHSGSRARHDALVGSAGAWLESLQALRWFGQTSVHTVMVTLLSKQGSDDLGHLMHLGMMGGMKEMEVRRVALEGRGRTQGEDLRPLDKNACDALSELWFDAKEEVIHFRAVGFDHTRDLGLTPVGPVRQADRAARELLRARVGLTQLPLGLSLLGEEAMAKDCTLLAQEAGGLDQAGLELAAHAAPLIDAPWCVGGKPFDTPVDIWGDDAHHGDACGDCPVRAACPGLPRKMQKLGGDTLRPLPTWTGVAEGRALVLGGSDDLLRTETLPALAEALTARGLQAAYAAEVPDDVATAALVVCGDAATARAVLAQVPAGAGRVVVLDTMWGDGLADLPRAPDVVASTGPGAVAHLVEAGIDLRTVQWRGYPAPPRCFAAEAGTRVVALGSFADWDGFERAALMVGNAVPPATAFVTGAGGPGSTRADVVRDADDATLLEALLGARLLVFPKAVADWNDPAARRAHARDLRWLDVAQAAGVAIAASRAPGVEEHVRHAHSGWLASAADHKELAGAMRQAHDPARTVGLARNGRLLARTSAVEAWADDLVDGRLPNASRGKGTDTMPWPPF